MKEIQNVHHVQMELILMDLAHLYVIIAQVEHIHIQIKKDVIHALQEHIQMKEIQNVHHVQKELILLKVRLPVLNVLQINM